MEGLFGGAALWFSIPAFFGTFIFLLRVALMLFGGHGDLDVDADVDFHADVTDHVDVTDHSTSAFKLLSLQTVSAFLMGFGWGGLGGLLGAGWDPISSFVFGAVTGTGMVWLLTKLLQIVMQLQSSGTVETSHALGLEGSVYTAIPAQRGGRGSVKVVIDDRLRYLNAVTDGESIPSKTRVRVIEINDDNTVTVSQD